MGSLVITNNTGRFTYSGNNLRAAARPCHERYLAHHLIK
jgi:hypothetical protein